jgi:4'-phosphopantetheinyl transferase
MRAQEAVRECRLVVIRATSSVLWEEARRACDEALARGFSFVAMLRGGEAYADEALLIDEDRQRAARFRQPRDRHNFMLGRAMVHHLVRPPGASMPHAFLRGPHGKPYLPDPPFFNLSHSDGWVACAVSQTDAIGIDVETFARLGDYRDLVPAIAHPAESRCIEQALPAHRLALFKRCWTRKEAVLKATGKGLTDNLRDIDVRLDLDEPLLSQPASLRLLDLPTDGAPAVVALAQAPSVPGVVVMLADISSDESTALQHSA